MQEIPSKNKNKRLESSTKHVGGSTRKKENFIDESPELDKHGLSPRDYN